MDDDSKKLSINFEEETPKEENKKVLFNQEIDEMLEEGFISFKPDDYKFTILLRKETNDLFVYQEIFTDQCYAFKANKDFNTIIDVGAYTGFSSIFFANLYPNARIIALEPAVINRSLCKLNTKFYPQITILPVALWPKKEDLFLFNTDKGSQHYQVGPQVKITENALYPVGGMSMTTLLETAQLTSIDLLKLSVEGLENTLLKNSTDWIQKVDSLIVRTSSSTALMSNPVLKTIKNLFKNSWQHETICFFSQGGIEKA